MSSWVLWERDAHTACVHEFGHLHVARHFGVEGFVRIIPNEHRADGDLWWYASFYSERIGDAKVRRLIGLAGLVAECMHVDSDVSADAILESIELGGSVLSTSDAAMSARFTKSDLNECVDLVRSRWGEIQRDAADYAAAKVTMHRLFEVTRRGPRIAQRRDDAARGLTSPLIAAPRALAWRCCRACM